LEARLILTAGELRHFVAALFTTMAKKSQISVPEISQEAIARRAYELWEAEGCPDGRATDHWLRAEEMLRGRAAEANAASDGQATSLPRPRRGTTPARRDKRFEVAL
jgi:hypothetical protein